MPEPLTYLCPYCDSEVTVGKPCPKCSKKSKKPAPKPKKTWEQDTMYDGLDLPDEDFDYDEFVAKEFGNVPHRKIGVKWYWWILGIIILIIFALTRI